MENNSTAQPQLVDDFFHSWTCHLDLEIKEYTWHFNLSASRSFKTQFKYVMFVFKNFSVCTQFNSPLKPCVLSTSTHIFLIFRFFHTIYYTIYITILCITPIFISKNIYNIKIFQWKMLKRLMVKFKNLLFTWTMYISSNKTL